LVLQHFLYGGDSTARVSSGVWGFLRTPTASVLFGDHFILIDFLKYILCREQSCHQENDDKVGLL